MSNGNPGEDEKPTLLSVPGNGDPDDAPTRLIPGRASGLIPNAAETADAPTRILERSSAEPAGVDKDKADQSFAEATRLMPSTPGTSHFEESATPKSPITHVSMPHGGPPAAPRATAVSMPIPSKRQPPRPRTAVSASPSSARTAGSAADRDELPKAGDFIKERFELTDELGHGGMGAVFRARDMRKMEALDPDPFVAIKFISGDLIGFERAFVALQREAKNAQALNHPNIVKVFDFDRDGALVFLTMEVVEGVSLHARMRESATKPMTVEERARLTHGMLAGMSYAHLRDLSHADLKPSNMMVDSNGDLKILDFGIARRREYDTVFDADDLFALTIDYASPEMLNRQRPTPTDDVYALGCIIYAMHTGAHPFNHVRADLARNEKMRPARPKSASRVQWQALRKSLAFSREQRFVDAAAFQRAYEALDWRKLGGIAAAVLSIALATAWFAADPLQSWMTVSGLDPARAAVLTRSLADGSEYLAGGYAEDAVFAYAEALTVDSHNAVARGGARAAFAAIQSKLTPDQYRDFLTSQLQDTKNPAWLKAWIAAELAGIPDR